MATTTDKNTITWLHLSDFQVHATDFDSPSYLTQWVAFLDDLERLHDEVGPIDIIFVTGDLTFSGQRDEFVLFRERMSELQQRLSELQRSGPDAVVLIVPGNHDVQRSQWTDTAEAKLLRFWGEDAALQSDFWKTELRYQEVIQHAFDNYLSLVLYTSLQPTIRTIGILPGDFSVPFRRGNSRVGIIGLNSAFLQLTDGDYMGRITLLPQQLEAVCDYKPDAWTRQHDYCLLLTHHPPEWMDAEAQRVFNTEIAPPGRFALHLCGHRHDKRPTARWESGSTLLVQAPPVISHNDAPGGYLVGTLGMGTRSDMFLNLISRRFSTRTQSYGPDPDYDPRIVEEYVSAYRRVVRLTIPVNTPSSAKKTEPIRLDRLELRNFRSIEHMLIVFEHDMQLPGHWTCLAGINGAGKSSVLQALCLVLLGEPLIRELGGDRLNRMRRFVDNTRQETEVYAWFRQSDKRDYVQIKLADEDSIPTGMAEIYRKEMQNFWQSMRSQIVLAYGATRNLSDYLDTRHSNLSPDVRPLMTLFDPLTQTASAEALLSNRVSPDSSLIRLFRSLLKQVFADSLDVSITEGRLRFTQDGNSVDALDLPDGFRSSVAWLADLCFAWCERFPKRASRSKPADIEAIVLIDEIDLHLHPSLQRILVPRLRAALPRVQWVVTTHSPLILSSFDSAEIVALDRKEPGGIRFLDRQILGFTTDQIYNWLMGTPAASAVMEEELERWNMGKGRPEEELAQLLDMSPTVNEEQAQERIQQRKNLLKRLAP